MESFWKWIITHLKNIAASKLRHEHKNQVILSHSSIITNKPFFSSLYSQKSYQRMIMQPSTKLKITNHFLLWSRKQILHKKGLGNFFYLCIKEKQIHTEIRNDYLKFWTESNHKSTSHNQSLVPNTFPLVQVLLHLGIDFQCITITAYIRAT